MAEYSGFFNAELDSNNQYDRTYAAEQFAQYFSAFIGNGVYITPSTQLKVVPVGNELAIYVSIGKAYINGYFYSNDDNLYKRLSNPNGANPRIDRIVLRLDLKTRKIYIDVLEGVASSSPVAKGILRNQYVYELALADVYVGATALTIVDTDITDLRANSLLCGYVHGVIDQIDTTNLFNQFQTSFNTLCDSANSKFVSLENKVANDFYTLHNQQDNTFKSWFENIKSQLSGDVAANLQRQIDENRERLSFDSIDTTVDGSSFANGEDGHMLVNDWTRNLLHCTLGTTTKDGITCTANGDGTYTLNGTATSQAAFIVGTLTLDISKQYKFIGCPSGGGTSSYSFAGANYVDFGNGSTIKNPIRSSVDATILVYNGVTVNNVVFKPMVVDGGLYPDTTYDNFVPYNKKITNLLNPTLQTQTTNGITLTNNGDGTYVLNGTASATTYFTLDSFDVTKSGKYKLVGITSVYEQRVIALYSKNSVGGTGEDTGRGAIYDLEVGMTFTCRLGVYNTSTTFNNLVIKPMLTENLDATYNDFVRYGVSHRNLLTKTLQTQTKNGVTCTNNGDGTYTVNGTATNNAHFLLQVADNFLPAGTYKLVGCPNVQNEKVHMHIRDNSISKSFKDYGGGVIFEAIPGNDQGIYIGIDNGATVSDITFKPMITTNLDATYNDFVKGQGAISVKSVGKNIFDYNKLIFDNNSGNTTHTFVNGLLTINRVESIASGVFVAAGHRSEITNALYGKKIRLSFDAKCNIEGVQVRASMFNVHYYQALTTAYVRYTHDYDLSNVDTTRNPLIFYGDAVISTFYIKNIMFEDITNVDSTDFTYKPYTEESIEVYNETETPAFGLMSHKGTTHIISNANVKATYPTSEGGVSFMETLYNHKDVSDNIREGLLAELQTNISVLQTQIDTNKSQISANKTRIDANKSVLDNHQVAINNQQEVVNNHTDQLEAMSDDISTMNGKVNDVTNSLETTERNMSTLTAQYNTLLGVSANMKTMMDYSTVSKHSDLINNHNLILPVVLPNVSIGNVNSNIMEVYLFSDVYMYNHRVTGTYTYKLPSMILLAVSQFTISVNTGSPTEICHIIDLIGDTDEKAYIQTGIIGNMIYKGTFIYFTMSLGNYNRPKLSMYAESVITIPAGTQIILPQFSFRVVPKLT